MLEMGRLLRQWSSEGRSLMRESGSSQNVVGSVRNWPSPVLAWSVRCVPAPDMWKGVFYGPAWRGKREFFPPSVSFQDREERIEAQCQCLGQPVHWTPQEEEDAETVAYREHATRTCSGMGTLAGILLRIEHGLPMAQSPGTPWPLAVCLERCQLAWRRREP